jgi:ADP-heptose:LPS heptosyltransferase/predicted SAM-dependent methyltransferase
MTWSLETSNGNESAKVRFDILPYVRGLGLDLGCGPFKVYPHAVGIDAQAYNTATGPNFCGDVTDLKMFADEAFDFVYSSHALEDQVDYVSVLRCWWRKVKVGGYLILYLPHRDFYPNIGQPGANPDHKHDFVPADIIAAMREIGGGWDLEVCEERNGGTEYSFLQVFRKTEHGLVESWRNPKPAKTCAVIRHGAYGDSLWASSVLPALKTEGYHITVYTQENGEEILRSDPHVDRIVIHSDYLTPAGDLLLFIAHIAQRYDRLVNLTHSVEGHMLPTLFNDPCYMWPDEVRRSLWSGVNYLERVHKVAGVPYEPRQKFYPTPDEAQWARAKRDEFRGPVVVLNPSGSTFQKWWPYTERFSTLLAERGIHCVVVGDLRGDPPKVDAEHGHVIGRDWTIRQAMAFAALADVVVGQESAIVNAVAFEAPLKVVLLSHSTSDNLTRDWLNTYAVEPVGLPCYPCHRLHSDASFCVVEKAVTGGAAACQALATPERVVELIDDYMRRAVKEAA